MAGHFITGEVAAHGPPVNDIRIAFGDSCYPTPYGDNSIPGNRPGHRDLRLGRSYAPVPVNRSQLTHAMVVPFVEGVSPTVECPSSSGDTNYILNVKYGGRRHFDEPRGFEAVHIPSLRRLGTPLPAMRAPQRKGLGRYNRDGCCHMNINDMEATSSLDEEHRRRGAGKAQVARPQDHSPAQLGLYHPSVGALGESMCRTATKASLQSKVPQSGISPRSVFFEAGENNTSEGLQRPAVGEPRGVLNFSSPYVDETRDIGKQICLGLSKRSVPAEDVQAGRRALDQVHTLRRDMRCASERREEVQIVRNLPSW